MMGIARGLVADLQSARIQGITFRILVFRLANDQAVQEANLSRGIFDELLRLTFIEIWDLITKKWRERRGANPRPLP
jgi:hypothetical protein